MSKIKSLLFPILALLSFSACSGENSGQIIQWQQQAQLQDGRVIAVDRISKITGKLLPENVNIEYEQTLNFTNPDTGEKISWLVPKGLAPNLIGFEGRVPYLVMRTGSVADYNTWDCPNPPFIIYWWKEGQWERIPFEQLPSKFTTPNLLLGATTDRKAVSDGVVTIEEMQRSIKESAKKFKIISREKIHPIAKGCHPDVLVKQGRESEINVKYRE